MCPVSCNFYFETNNGVLLTLLSIYLYSKYACFSFSLTNFGRFTLPFMPYFKTSALFCFFICELRQLYRCSVDDDILSLTRKK
jgi:hypothetical protein